MFSMSEPLRTRLCVSYFVKFTLLLITIASTNAAQQIAKIKPKIIIILILSSFVILIFLTLLALVLPKARLANTSIFAFESLLAELHLSSFVLTGAKVMPFVHAHKYFAY